MGKGSAPAVIDVFAGAGGLSLGAARAGFEVRAAIEIDPHASASHHLNFPNCVTLQQDVAAMTGQQLLDAAGLKVGGLSGLIGSPPCQGFSTIGRRDSEDSRNDLFIDFFRLVLETRPIFFVAENVPGILQSSHVSLVRKALDSVEHSFHNFGPFVLSASDFGAPTSRKRVFFVGVRKSEFSSFADECLKPPVNGHKVFVQDALRGLPGTVDADWRSNPVGRVKLRSVHKSNYLESILDRRPSGVGAPDIVRLLVERQIVLGHQSTVHSDKLRERYASLGPGETDPITKSRRLEGSGFCPTLRAGTGREKGSFQAVRPIHYRHPRVITPREAARLQSFPDWYAFHSTKWHSFRQIGNSVPPLLAEAVLSKIKSTLSL